MSVLETIEKNTIEKIGVIRSPYPTRFAIPRQPGLVPSAKYTLVLENTEDMRLALRGLEEFSHIWVLFQFHQLKRDSWKPLVHPPRLGGKKSVGVFATRSPYRPNSIGMSAVKLVSVELNGKEGPELVVMGGDFLDGTPIVDIKPYVPYADILPDATSAWAQQQHPSLEVLFNELSESFLQRHDASGELRQLIIETLALDPRPGHERGKDAVGDQQWGVEMSGVELKWTVKDNQCRVLKISELAICPEK